MRIKVVRKRVEQRRKERQAETWAGGNAERLRLIVSGPHQRGDAVCPGDTKDTEQLQLGEK
jgi:hypothetical protein